MQQLQQFQACILLGENVIRAFNLMDAALGPEPSDDRSALHFQELIAAVAAAPGADIARSFQRQQDLLQKLFRQFFLCCQFLDLQTLGALDTGQGHHGLESITGTLRNHAPI